MGGSVRALDTHQGAQSWNLYQFMEKLNALRECARIPITIGCVWGWVHRWLLSISCRVPISMHIQRLWTGMSTSP